MSIAFIDLKAQQARIRDKVEAGFQTVLDHGAYIMGAGNFRIGGASW